MWTSCIIKFVKIISGVFLRYTNKSLSIWKEIAMGVYRFRRGYGGRISGRRRLTALKRALYKLKNNRSYQAMPVAA